MRDVIAKGAAPPHGDLGMKKDGAAVLANVNATLREMDVAGEINGAWNSGSA